MSRLIKGAIFGEEPKLVEIPVKKKHAVVPEEENTVTELSEEAQQNMLATIRKKEEEAIQLLKDAKIQAEITKQEAKSQAENILEQARSDADKMQDEAHKQGYQKGIEEGRQAGETQIREELHHLLVEGNANAERTLNEARDLCRDYVMEAENTIAEMAMRIADKVLPQHFIDVPTLILPLVREAIQKVKDQPHVVVKVAPDAYELVMMAQSEFRSQLEGSATLEVKSDESLKIGDVVVESPNGVVDAKLSTQLELVEQAVRNVMK